MSNYYSATKILNDVYSGETLNTIDYASGTNILNAVYSEDDNALMVNISGFTGPVDVSYDDDLYYDETIDTLYTPNLVITSGQTSSFQMLDTVTGLPYNIYIASGVLTIAAV